jgi:hypothetical protein
VVRVCNLSYIGGKGRPYSWSEASPGKKNERPYLKNNLRGKRAGSMTQVVEDPEFKPPHPPKKEKK